MKSYTFEEIEIGTMEEFSVDITDENMELFAKLTGDLNPIHVDADYARMCFGGDRYRDRLVYGMLASSYYSTLVGMYLPGERGLLNSCNVIYRNPVYIGDCLLVHGEVVDKREGTHRVKIRGEMTNQENVVVNSAEIMVGFTNVE